MLSLPRRNPAARPGLLILAFSLCSGLAAAQDFNIDEGFSNSPVPPSSVGGPARSAGTWDRCFLSAAMFDIHGTYYPNAGFDDSLGCPGYFSCNDPATPAPDDALLDDGQYCQPLLSAGFYGLANGTYIVYTVVFRPCASAVPQRVTVVGALEPPEVLSAAWSGSYARGENFARHTVHVTTGGISFGVQPNSGTGTAYFNGVQIVKVNETDATPMCFGDGSGAACPCGNGGSTGHGCQNSAGTGGAELYASGGIAPDTLVLRSEGELPTALSIFLQGNAVVPVAPFGDGLRCAGGILKRLYVKHAEHGLAVAPEPGDLRITQQSAALGDPIAPGERRYYQVYYRDPDLAFCAAPAGGSFNVSNMLKVVW